MYFGGASEVLGKYPYYSHSELGGWRGYLVGDINYHTHKEEGHSQISLRTTGTGGQISLGSSGVRSQLWSWQQERSLQAASAPVPRGGTNVTLILGNPSIFWLVDHF